MTLVDTAGRGVDGFTENGIVVGGVEFELDCLIMATGFDSNIPYTQLTGFDFEARGTTLSQHWSGGVRTLHGMSTDQFPNLFFIGGNPQTAAAVNAVHLLDEQAHYVAHAVAEATDRGASMIEATRADVDAYVELIMTSPKNKAMFEFFAQCTPGYYNAEGKARRSEDLFIGGRYGDGALAYYALLRDWAENGDLAGYALKTHVTAS